jgi:hypothetical protein
MAITTYYINSAGSNTYPFDTVEKGAHDWEDLIGAYSYGLEGYDIVIVLCSDTNAYYSVDKYIIFFTFSGYAWNVNSFTIKSNIVGTKRKIDMKSDYGEFRIHSVNPISDSFVFEDIDLYNGILTDYYDYSNINIKLGTLTFTRCHLNGIQSTWFEIVNLIIKNNIISLASYCDSVENFSTEHHNNVFISNVFLNGSGCRDAGTNLDLIIIQNNIFYGVNNYINLSTAAIESHIDNNCFYGMPSNYCIWGYAVIGSNNIGLEDPESFGTDPKFGVGYRLASDSPCLDAGITNSYTPTDDYDGVARDNPIDMGAYQSEFDPPPTETYNVTYNGNEELSGTVPIDLNDYALSATVTVLSNSGDLIKDNYMFIGWNTSADGSGISYPVSSTFSIVENTTLYAYWILQSDERRFGPNREINLTDYLSDYHKEKSIYDLVEFFETFLNQLYSGEEGLIVSEVNISADNDYIRYEVSDNNLSSADHTISILEKINRLADLHDPELIDMDFLQFFAGYLGYNVKITKDKIGAFGSFDLENISEGDRNRYIRHMVSNLPNWIKIKTTKNAARIMLYSFGLIGDIITYYTNDYDKNWKLDYEGDLLEIPDSWYPTPHFATLIDIDATIENNPSSAVLDVLMQDSDTISKAIRSIKPLNTVFKGMAGKTVEQVTIYVKALPRLSYYEIVE